MLTGSVDRCVSEVRLETSDSEGMHISKKRKVTFIDSESQSSESPDPHLKGVKSMCCARQKKKTMPREKQFFHFCLFSEAAHFQQTLVELRSCLYSSTGHCDRLPWRV